MTLNWDYTYSVGVKEIDEQHQKFFAIINDLYAHFQEMKPREELVPILDRLVDYAEYHFATEEKYFDQFHYEQADEHKAAHQGFTVKMEGFRAKYDKGEEDLTIQLLDFLEDWLVHHINNVDKKFTECFHEHGLY